MSAPDDRFDQLLLLLREQRSEMAALRVAVDGGRAAPQKAPVRVAELYVDYKAARQHEHSWRMIDDKLHPLVRLAGSESAIELTPARWDKHRQKRRTEVMDYGRSKGRPPAETTLNIELGCAKVMLEWGVDHGYLSHNPLRKTRRAKTKGPRKTWLRESDLQRLLDAPEPKGRVQRLTLRAFILVIFDTGLRFEEARRLRRDRARERDEFDEITGDSAIGWVVDIDETKNRKAHTVGLTPRAWDALHALGEVPGSPYFFTRPETKALWGERTIRWWFRRACEESGVDALVAEGEIQVRPHDGRRSAATNAHNRGGSLLEVQRMLNHTSPAITAQYVQQNEANAIRMARIMEDGAARERRRRPPKRVCEGETQTAKSERTGTA